MKNEERERGLEDLLRQKRVETRPADVCPEADILAAWTDGGLHATESAMVESHVSNCARCQAILAAMVAPVDEAASVAPVSLWRRWQLGWLVPITAAAAAIVVWVVVPTDAPVAVDQSARVAEGPVAVVAEPPRQERAQSAIEAQTSPTPTVPAPAPSQPQRSALADAAAPAVQELRRESVQQEAKAAPAPPPVAEPVVTPPPPVTVAATPTSPLPSPPPPSPPPPPAVAGAAPPDVQSAARAQSGVASALGNGTGAGADNVRGFGRGGRGGAPVAAVAEEILPPVLIISPEPAIRWRIRGSSVDLSTNAGASWDLLQSGVAGLLTAGSSPSPSVCWIVGRTGAVIVTTDMRTWRRVAFPEPIDLTAIEATDAQTATVTAGDGRRWRTTNGGDTWSTLQDF